MGDPYIVFIYSTEDKQPVAHSPSTHDVRLDLDDGWTSIINATPCGQSTYVWDERCLDGFLHRSEYRNEQNIENLGGVRLPLKHARLFTRPCRTCFPEKDGQW